MVEHLTLAECRVEAGIEQIVEHVVRKLWNRIRGHPYPVELCRDGVPGEHGERWDQVEKVIVQMVERDDA